MSDTVPILHEEPKDHRSPRSSPTRMAPSQLLPLFLGQFKVPSFACSLCTVDFRIYVIPGSCNLEMCSTLIIPSILAHQLFPHELSPTPHHLHLSPNLSPSPQFQKACSTSTQGPTVNANAMWPKAITAPPNVLFLSQIFVNRISLPKTQQLSLGWLHLILFSP